MCWDTKLKIISRPSLPHRHMVHKIPRYIKNNTLVIIDGQGQNKYFLAYDIYPNML